MRLVIVNERDVALVVQVIGTHLAFDTGQHITCRLPAGQKVITHNGCFLSCRGCKDFIARDRYSLADLNRLQHFRVACSGKLRCGSADLQARFSAESGHQAIADAPRRCRVGPSDANEEQKPWLSGFCKCLLQRRVPKAVRMLVSDLPLERGQWIRIESLK